MFLIQYNLGRDWQWGTQDGGQGQVGVVYRVERSSKSVRVSVHANSLLIY